MIPGITFDDGSLIGEDELNAIETRVHQARYYRGDNSNRLFYGPTDSAQQAVADRARLLRLLKDFEASPKWRKI